MVERAFGAQVVVRVPNSYIGVRASARLWRCVRERCDPKLQGPGWPCLGFHDLFFLGHGRWRGSDSHSRHTSRDAGRGARVSPAGRSSCGRAVSYAWSGTACRQSDGSFSPFIPSDIFLGSLTHMKYALQGSVLAICLKQVGGSLAAVLEVDYRRSMRSRAS
jgi:hypothetical protein